MFSGQSRTIMSKINTLNTLLICTLIISFLMYSLSNYNIITRVEEFWRRTQLTIRLQLETNLNQSVGIEDDENIDTKGQKWNITQILLVGDSHATRIHRTFSVYMKTSAIPVIDINGVHDPPYYRTCTFFPGITCSNLVYCRWKEFIDYLQRYEDIYPIPEPGGMPEEILKKRELQGIIGEYVTNISNYNTRTELIHAGLNLLANNTNLRRIYPHKYLCNSTSCHVFTRRANMTSANFESYYDDTNHLSRAGVQLFIPEMLKKLDLSPLVANKLFV